MAPTLSERYYYDNCDGYGYCYSTWDRWGRWAALGLIIFFVILVFLMFSCFNARRRRRQGLTPYYGTGWTTGKYNGNYNGGYHNNQGPPAPPYSPRAQHPQYTGNTFNSNDGYYGQQSGIELQHPSNAYAPPRAAEQVYDAPAGPPPKKTGY